MNCTHCDEVVITPYTLRTNGNEIENEKAKEHVFCCTGCLNVFRLLTEKGLSEYYEIKESSAIIKRRSPVLSSSNLATSKFKYIDHPEFMADYAYDNHGLIAMDFYLEGIHCQACLWLIEKMPEFRSEVREVNLNLQSSIVTITMKKDFAMSIAASELNHLGYTPHPLKSNEELKLIKKKEERAMLLRIAIAGAAAGNIMLYAVSIYAGVDGLLLTVFNWITILFALPVFGYSAWPFYENAWRAIKSKTLSIDLPISISLIAGAVYGVVCELMGIHENFYDSLTALVFLLLLARYFLFKLNEDALDDLSQHFFYQQDAAFKKEGDLWIEVPPATLKKDDIIKIMPQSMISVDGIIVEGNSMVNNSLLTGESRSVAVTINSPIFAGTKNERGEIIVRVEKNNRDTRLGLFLKQVEVNRHEKPAIVDLMTKVSKWFILTIVLMAIFTFIDVYILHHGLFSEALSKAITLLIVTCPCALALATPLTLTRSLSNASKKGIVVKSELIIEKLSKISQVFIDKTGTITYGVIKIKNFKWEKIPFDLSEKKLWEILYDLESQTSHPVGLALLQLAKEKGAQASDERLKEWTELEEIMGTGPKGKFSHYQFEIKKQQFFANNHLLATFKADDILRPDSKFAIQNLKKLNIHLTMLTGDIIEFAKKLGSEAGLRDEEILAEQSPEDKLSTIKLAQKNHLVAAIGDGANDAMALSRADVGIAVYGAMDLSLTAADVYLTTPGLSTFFDLVVISKETMKVIYRNLFISLAYNCISLYLAMTGGVTPLTAAIIMPISSLTVLFSSLIGTPLLNRHLKTNRVTIDSTNKLMNLNNNNNPIHA